MSNNPASPLLGGNEHDENAQTTSQNGKKQGFNSDKRPPTKSKYSDESTPLLSRDPDREDEDENAREEVPVPSLYGDSIHQLKSRWRLPTIISIVVLSLLLIAILAFGFALPSVVKEYTEQALVFEPTDLSIVSITGSGVKARVQGDLVLDASRVERKPVRDLGKLGTWIARAVEAKPSNVHVYLPERDGAVLGTAQIPSVVIFIRNGVVNHIDIVSDVAPGDFDDLRQVAKDWIDGRLSELRVTGKADVALKSGILSLGTQTVSKDMVFKGMFLTLIPLMHGLMGSARINHANFATVRSHQTQHP